MYQIKNKGEWDRIKAEAIKVVEDMEKPSGGVEEPLIEQEEKLQRDLTSKSVSQEITSEICPLCPYCSKDLSKRKPPSRRSTFKCPACAKPIHVEPNQPLYPTPYLDNVQATYVYFLWQLNHWVFGIGSNDDYLRKRAELTKRFGKDPGIGDVIWGLMNESLAEACSDQWECRDMKNLMNEFRTFEKKTKRGGRG